MYATGLNISPLRRLRPPNPWSRRWRRLAIWLAVSALFAFGLATAAHGSAPTSYDTVTIGVGDTLWTVAAQRYPGSDTRQKVDEIRRANGLTSPEVYPGEVLRVPAA
jgi:hypothetical protein